jgi:predicted SnoaL-like aldol condensation-catalyzing enzyme
MRSHRYSTPSLAYKRGGSDDTKKGVTKIDTWRTTEAKAEEHTATTPKT